MIVTDIVSLDKKKSVIYIEGEPFCALYKGELKRFSITAGNEITPETMEDILIVLKKRCRERAFYILKNKDYTEKELRDKLILSRFPLEIIEDTIILLKNYNYINDESYAERFCEEHLCKESVKIVKYKLISKGISKDIIDKYIEMQTVNPVEVLRKVYAKKIELYNNSDDKTKRKIYNMFLRKGFSYDDINCVLKNC